MLNFFLNISVKVSIYDLKTNDTLPYIYFHLNIICSLVSWPDNVQHLNLQLLFFQHIVFNKIILCQIK